MQTEPRNSHPYFMHDAILAQPEAFVRAVERNENALDEFASRIASCERIFLSGIGTSHHVSLVGEHLMRAPRQCNAFLTEAFRTIPLGFKRAKC